MAGLILLSCSDKKEKGGTAFPSAADPIPWLKNHSLRRRLFETRARVLDLIKANRLVDSEKKQGNRGTDPRNSNLVQGLDFGGDDRGGAYLPACIRYEGRFFRTIRGRSSEGELIAKWQCMREGYRTLIVSGLYGLISPLDPIQEYSCHFADRISGDQVSLQLLWRDLLTDIIHGQFDGEKGYLVDLLSEESYEDAFSWHSIYKNIKCLHRAYKLKSGAEALINSARFFEDQFLGQEGPEPLLFPDRFISKSYFDDPREQILFESELKMTRKEVAREGIKEVLPELKKRYHLAWDCLSNAIRIQIANSEYSYVRNRDLLEFDFTSASICLSKAIEIWLEENIVGPMVEIKRFQPLLKNVRGKLISAQEATIGEVYYFLLRVRDKIEEGLIRNDIATLFPAISPRDINELASELRTISHDYRNAWAHKKLMPSGVYEKFRRKAYEFFARWVPKWKKGKGFLSG